MPYIYHTLHTKFDTDCARSSQDSYALLKITQFSSYFSLHKNKINLKFVKAISLVSISFKFQTNIMPASTVLLSP